MNPACWTRGVASVMIVGASSSRQLRSELGRAARLKRRLTNYPRLTRSLYHPLGWSATVRCDRGEN